MIGTGTGTETLVSKLVAKKDVMNELKYFEKYRDIVDATIYFLRRHNAEIMLYGGAAINSLLPSPNKIYRDTELPDFDVFALDGEKMAEELVKFMQARGYEYVSKRPAMHAGTWKINIEGVEIADFSTLPRPLFQALHKEGRVGSIGVHTADLEYLRHTMILVMATPANTNRWKKVLPRLKLFNKSFPPKVPKIPKATVATRMTDAQATAVKHVTAFAKRHKYVRIGADAIQELLPSHSLPAGYLGAFSSLLVNGDITKAARSLCATLKKKGVAATASALHRSPYPDSRDVPSDHIVIHAAGAPITCIYANDMCWSYEVAPENGTRRGTLPTLLSWLSRQMFVGPKHIPQKNMASLYSLLTDMLIKDRNINRHYTLQCYGKETGLFTMKKEQFVQKKNKNNNAAK